MANHPTDEEVLRRVRGGDAPAFAILFDRYFSRVERYADCLLQDAGEAAAVASATFVRALHDARRVGGENDRYPAHLFLICRRRVMSRLGRRWPGFRRSYREAWPDWQPGTEEDIDELPLSIILSNERDALIQAALDGLAVEDREIVRLAFEPGLSPGEIRSIVKAQSESAVTARLLRALRRLGAAVLQSDSMGPAETGRVRDRVKHWART